MQQEKLVKATVPWYDEEKLKNDLSVNFGREYQRCSLSLMDTIADPDIRFDEKGICNYYYDYKKAEATFVLHGASAEAAVLKTVNEIKAAAGKSKYDCILGLSGGVDSSYLAWYAKSVGLNPLLVHFDYGWNSELAVNNIENIVNKVGLDLYTYVMDWEEFRDLQRSYFKASVLDLDVPADHMIFGALYKVANEQNIKFILSGKNVVTEAVLPKAWNYRKFDLVNLKNIHKAYGTKPLLKLPALGAWHFSYYTSIKNIRTVELLNFVDYDKSTAKKFLMEELGWKDYGGKHYESVFTRFYQGYILPRKFHIDKRKAHLSNLIFSGQITLGQAHEEIAQPMYPIELMKQDKEFVAKKLGFTETEFEEVLSLPNRTHESFGTDEKVTRKIAGLVNSFKAPFQIIKKFIH